MVRVRYNKFRTVFEAIKMNEILEQEKGFKNLGKLNWKEAIDRGFLLSNLTKAPNEAMLSDEGEISHSKSNRYHIEADVIFDSSYAHTWLYERVLSPLRLAFFNADGQLELDEDRLIDLAKASINYIAEQEQEKRSQEISAMLNELKNLGLTEAQIADKLK